MAVAQDHWAARWVATCDGDVPPNSFWEGDHAIGRGWYEGGLHVGYVSEGHRGLVIGYGGREVVLREYEVLTGDKSHFHWVKCEGACRPQYFIPLKGGHEADGRELYIGRTEHHGKDRIGKAGQHLINGMNYVHDGHETSAHHYYVFAFRT
ncbi:hypothetical protein RclHR1_06690007 [Rhizophagus clarus]|uniref:Carbohydrate-binding module family 12 protein n=1 Tax=Rhizophagus clarus TaxID=94130 RepID=A0A2Z6SAQ2_9GLOM|nr:hypothetical protein RclHR1_06690007 [Rhizophagus clarus]GES92956.1 carbohydrate-binding module family 12 protein [Rhizophagus clarus]